MGRRKGSGPSSSRGYVYFISAPEVGRVKIGYTLLDPDVRFVALNVASPVALEKWALMRGTFQIERELHERFSVYSVKGEWFRQSTEIAGFVADVARPWASVLADGDEGQYAEMVKRYREFVRAESVAWMQGIGIPAPLKPKDQTPEKIAARIEVARANRYVRLVEQARSCLGGPVD